MLSREAQDLCDHLLRQRIISSKELDQYLQEIDSSKIEQSNLLDHLSRRGALTAYQIEQIRKNQYQTLILGEYVLLYHNASGSFARVYRARSLRDGSMVGIKLLRRRWSQDPKSVSQFHREAELGKTLHHENIVPIYSVEQSGESHYIVMEFVEGGNLLDFIQIRKQLSPAEATRCALDMVSGLEYALKMGMTHRDLKLSNVLMSSKGVAKLVDFGLAGLEIPGESEGSGQRALEYATLEDGSGAPRNDPRSDLYFLGTIFYELLTGSPPYPRTKSRAERKLFSRYSGIRPISQVAPYLPRTVSKIIDRLLQTNPMVRYQSPSDVLPDLKFALTDLGSTVPVAPVPALNAGGGVAMSTTQPVILCVENRPKHQDILRQYFSKRGFRVLMLGDIQRAAQRAQQARPECVVVMGDALGDELPIELQRAWPALKQSDSFCAILLGQDQGEMADRLPKVDNIAVLKLPLTLHDLRKKLQEELKRRGKWFQEPKADQEEPE